MNTTYEARGWMKQAEEDNFDQGEIGNGSECAGNDVFEGKSLDELLSKLKDFACEDDADCIELDACETPGRIDIHTVQNKHGFPASNHEKEQFQRNEINLWSVTFTFHVAKTTREVVELTAAQNIA